MLRGFSWGLTKNQAPGGTLLRGPLADFMLHCGQWQAYIIRTWGGVKKGLKQWPMCHFSKVTAPTQVSKVSLCLRDLPNEKH